MKLYEIANELNDTVSGLDQLLEDGEIDQATYDDSLCGIVESLKDKAGSVIAYIKNLQAEADVFKAEARRLSDSSKSISNKSDRLKGYLKQCMVMSGMDKIKDGVHSASIGKPSKILFIEDGATIPEQYLKVVETPNKAELKKAIQSGEEFKGIILKDGASRFTIK